MRIAIASGKGGTGKTFVSTNLYSLMESLGHDVVLIDCDAEVPNDSIFLNLPVCGKEKVETYIPALDKDKCVYCGACADICHYHALTCIPAVKYIKLIEESCHGCHACEYVCKQNAITPSWNEVGEVTAYGKNGRSRLFEGSMKVRQKSPVSVIEKTISLAEAEGADYMILDAPPGCSCPFVHTVLDADFVLLVTEPTPFGLSDLKHSIDVLCTMDKHFGVIINRADLGGVEMKEYLAAENIEIFAEIPFSQEVARKYAEGRLIIGNSEVELEFRKILDKLLKYESSVC